MEKILLIEDSPEYQYIVEESLRPDFELHKAETVSDALLQIDQKKFDLYLIDIELPDGDGFQVCSQLKNVQSTAEIPVIFLTGRHQTDQKVLGFSLGADDYVVKPFDPLELRARVSARLRRANRGTPNTLSVGPLRVDLIRQKTTIVADGGNIEVDLSPIELRLLMSFLNHPNRILSRSELLKDAMRENVHVLERTIDKHICSLREKLGAYGDSIKTVYRKGYLFSILDVAVGA